MNRLSTEQLNKLPTHRLLALYRKRRAERDSIGGGWFTDYGTYPEALQDPDDPLAQRWHDLNEYCEEIKPILDQRENVEKKT